MKFENFGKFLLGRGALTRAQLVEASQAQVVFGGRLGTNLVELGVLGLDELERHLSDYLGVGIAPPEMVGGPEPAALAAVRKSLVRRHPILPLAIEKRTLHVAMLDPCDPTAIDEVGFATGSNIQPYVMCELRLGALIEHHYGIPQEIRFSEPGSSARDRGAPAATNGHPDRGEGATAEPAELIDEQTFAALHERWQGSDVAAPAPASDRQADTEPLGSEPRRECEVSVVDPASTLSRLESELATADDRDTVAQRALSIACLYVDAAALFLVRGGTVSGFRGVGEGMPATLDGILMSAETSVLFADPAVEERPFRGAPPEDGVGRRVVEALGRRSVCEVLVHPIAIRGRVVNLLYVDNGERSLSEISVAAMTALCQCVSRAYERLILESKGRFV